MPSDTDIPGRMVALWRDVAPRMADLPIYNPTLTVQATEFRRHGEWLVGVVVTPWFMNVVGLREALPPPGSPIVILLPAGEVEATVADLDGLGRFAAASLFSPMDMFDDPTVTWSVAKASLAALFAGTSAPCHLDRRALLRGRA